MENGPAKTTPPADDFFKLLSSRDRRRVLYFLQEHSTATLSELCDVLAGWRAVDGPGVVGTETRGRIRASLHHTDLPIFEAVGVLEYDRNEQVASLVSLPAELPKILRTAQAYDEAVAEKEG